MSHISDIVAKYTRKVAGAHGPDYYGITKSSTAAIKFEKYLADSPHSNVYSNRVQGQYEIHFEPEDGGALREAKDFAQGLGIKIRSA
jgi:hypothetical protein